MRQDDANRFTDVTALAKLPATITSTKYTGAWTADIEADGDLDIVLGNDQGQPTVLRNNGDETFLETHPFEGVSGVRGFAWADLDADGDPDASLIDGSDKLQFFTNLRQGQFANRPLPATVKPVRAINITDINSDGMFDLLAVENDGQIIRISDKNEGQDWESTPVANVNDSKLTIGQSTRLLVADLDNNGGFDLVVASSSEPGKTSEAIWLSEGNGSLKILQQSSGFTRLFDIADLNSDGRLDLVGLAEKGQASRALTHSSKNYHWQVVRPHASQASGDQRINPFGVGGEMEIRTGLMLQKQPIDGPMLHFGLGEQTSADVIRVVWPNGTVRAEFEVKGDQEVVTEQRLKASCPFLFAYNGKQMEFVKDAVPWGSAIGLRINTIGQQRLPRLENGTRSGAINLFPTTVTTTFALPLSFGRFTTTTTSG